MSRIITLFTLTCLSFGAHLARAQAPVEVEPSELSRRRDLIGREIVIDDRVKYFFPVTGKGYPEIILSRTDTTIMLPPNLAYDSRPSAKAVRARGILRARADGKGLFLDATQAPELFVNDLERLKSTVATLSPEDAAAKSAWGDWAARRAKAFDDPALKAIADSLQSDAIAIEYRQPGSRSPESLMALAKKARAKDVQEPQPSAIAHMGLRLRMATAKTTEDYQKIADEALAFLRDSKTPSMASSRLALDDYLADPYQAYRKADLNTRSALDRRLWTDAIVESFKLRAAGDPGSWKKLGDEARTKMPDRPDIGGDLIRRYYENSAANVAQLRESDMRELARTTRQDLNQPEKADALTRSWLENQRVKFLGANNAEQRIELAGKYLAYLKDKVVAADLLREALKIDPENREASDLFLRMGYVKNAGAWRDPSDPTVKPSVEPGAAPPSGKDDPFLGLTPTEVRAQLGEPKSVAKVATQGRVTIQWVYKTGQGEQYINFLQTAGDPQPTVTGRFLLR